MLETILCECAKEIYGCRSYDVLLKIKRLRNAKVRNIAQERNCSWNKESVSANIP